MRHSSSYKWCIGIWTHMTSIPFHSTRVTLWRWLKKCGVKSVSWLQCSCRRNYDLPGWRRLQSCNDQCHCCFSSSGSLRLSLTHIFLSKDDWVQPYASWLPCVASCPTYVLNLLCAEVENLSNLASKSFSSSVIIRRWGPLPCISLMPCRPRFIRKAGLWKNRGVDYF